LLRLDISKAMNELGWRPKWDTSTAVELTVNWYKNALNPQCDQHKLCLNDLQLFIRND